MAEVKKLDRSMIVSALADLGLDNFDRGNGSYQILFKGGPTAMIAIVAAEGDDEQELAVYVHLEEHPQGHSEESLYRVCNLWNRLAPLPKAYVDEDGEIALEQHVILSSGIHPELLQELIIQAIGFGWKFWDWAREEQGLF